MARVRCKVALTILSGIAGAVVLLTGCTTNNYPPPTGPLPTEPETEPNCYVVKDTLIALVGSQSVFYCSLQGGDGEFDGHRTNVYGGISLAVRDGRIYVDGTITFREVTQDYTTAVAQIHARLGGLPEGYECLSIMSGTRAEVPASFSCPTGDHTVRSVPLIGEFADDLAAQIDRVGSDVPGYTAVVGINYRSILVRVRRPCGT